MFKRLLFIMVLLVAIFSVTLVILNQQPSLANNNASKSMKKLHEDKKKKSVPEVGLSVGNRAPNITLKNLQDQTVNLADYRGKIVLLNFWATWCSPCREEIPDLVQFYKKIDHRNIEILAVNATTMEEGGTKAVQAFAQKNGMSFPILLDNQEEALASYGVVTIPTSYLLDENGVIIAKHIGPVDGTWINNQLK